ncbi:hypothetical protein DV515_00013096 [Chloebia gouldiae]|uniref:Uncharacterized protein n=1 Tax=Chloebia gouldiae TaxID=44316 RepID=A0A3L8S293_CHLGU|nr:hypothetical protein DV515_00013096 [Chloebia gouldiae]
MSPPFPCLGDRDSPSCQAGGQTGLGASSEPRCPGHCSVPGWQERRAAERTEPALCPLSCPTLF